MAGISEEKLTNMLDSQAKSLCCNRRVDGYCCTKDMMCAWRKLGEKFSNRGIICKWFREAVLPADRELEQLYLIWRQSEIDKQEAQYRGLPLPTNSVFGGDDFILCLYCRKPFIRASNHQMYCDVCGKTSDKKVRAARKRFERSQQP